VEIEADRCSSPCDLVREDTAMDAEDEFECHDVMDLLTQKDSKLLFMEPVDAVALDIPDYHDIIKFPMDFTTIRTKLANGAYPGVTAECMRVALQLMQWIQVWMIGPPMYDNALTML
jgi:hypothetical protein